MIEPSSCTARMIQRWPFLTQAPCVVVRSQRAFLRVATQSPAEAVNPSARVTVAADCGSFAGLAGVVGVWVSRSRRARSLSWATRSLVGANRMESRPAARSAAQAW